MNQLMRPPRSVSPRWSQIGGVVSPVGRPVGSRVTPIQGGKGRFGIGEQCGLVAVDREEVVATVGDDLLRDITLGQQGVRRDHPPRDRHPLQQRLRGGQLVPLPAARTCPTTVPDACAYAATRYVPGTVSDSSARFGWLPRSTFPSRASPARTGRSGRVIVIGGVPSVRASHSPSAASKAATSNRLYTR